MKTNFSLVRNMISNINIVMNYITISAYNIYYKLITMIKSFIYKKNVHVALGGVGINANSGNNKDSVPLKSPG